MRNPLVLAAVFAVALAGAYWRTARVAESPLAPSEKASLRDAVGALNDDQFADVNAQAKKLKKDGTFSVTITKKPKSVDSSGPVAVYHFNMTGTADYQWVYVRDERSRAFVESLLKAMKVPAGMKGYGIKTLAEVQAEPIVPGEYADEHARERAQLTADLHGHEAVVYSYENPAE